MQLQNELSYFGFTKLQEFTTFANQSLLSINKALDLKYPTSSTCQSRHNSTNTTAAMDQSQKNEAVAQFLSVTGASPSEVYRSHLHVNFTSIRTELTHSRPKRFWRTVIGTLATPSRLTSPTKMEGQIPTLTWTPQLPQKQSTPDHEHLMAVQHQSHRPEL